MTTAIRSIGFYSYRDSWWYDPERFADNTLFMVGDYGDGKGGCTWEFAIAEYVFSDSDRKYLRVKVFSDAFEAFTAIPEFFTGLAALGEMATAEQVLDLMQSLDFADRTERVSPYASEA